MKWACVDPKIRVTFNREFVNIEQETVYFNKIFVCSRKECYVWLSPPANNRGERSKLCCLVFTPLFYLYCIVLLWMDVTYGLDVQSIFQNQGKFLLQILCIYLSFYDVSSCVYGHGCKDLEWKYVLILE